MMIGKTPPRTLLQFLRDLWRIQIRITLRDDSKKPTPAPPVAETDAAEPTTRQCVMISIHDDMIYLALDNAELFEYEGRLLPRVCMSPVSATGLAHQVVGAVLLAVNDDGEEVDA